MPTVLNIFINMKSNTIQNNTINIKLNKFYSFTETKYHENGLKKIKKKSVKRKTDWGYNNK